MTTGLVSASICESEFCDVPDVANIPALTKHLPVAGIAAMLEMLRVLSSIVAEGAWQPRVNIFFIFFGAEEQGSIGSHRYVHNCRASSDSSTRLRRHRQDCGLPEHFRFHASGGFRGALIIDQIGYIEPSREQGIPMVVESDGSTVGAATLLRKLVRAGRRYTPEARISYSLKADRSDHFSFSLEHSASALSRESFVNPCYHSTCDTVDRLSPVLLEAVTKMNLAAALELDGENEVRMLSFSPSMSMVTPSVATTVHENCLSNVSFSFSANCHGAGVSRGIQG